MDLCWFTRWQVDRRFTGESEDRRRVNLLSPTQPCHLTIIGMIIVIIIGMVFIMVIIVVIRMKRLKMRITKTTMIVLSFISELCYLLTPHPRTHPTLSGKSLKMSLVCIRAFLLLSLVLGAQSAPKSQTEGSLSLFTHHEKAALD